MATTVPVCTLQWDIFTGCKFSFFEVYNKCIWLIPNFGQILENLHLQKFPSINSGMILPYTRKFLWSTILGDPV